MSYDEHDDFDQNGPKALREALEKANKALEAAQKQNADLQGSLNEIKLGNVFTEKKVPSALQRLMKAEKVEASAEAVDKWLADNGSDFGWKPDSGETVQPEGQQVTPEEAPVVQSVLTEDDIAAQQRIQQVTTTGVGQTTTSDQAEAVVNGIAGQLGESGSFDDAVKLLQASGMFDIQTTIASR